MLRFFHQLRRFLTELAADPRIPARDKAVFVGLCAYLATPLDLVPDFIPVVGYLDDAVVAVVVLDYIFNVVPEPVLLDHFPWTPEKCHRVRRWVRLVSWLIPNFIRRKLWKQVKMKRTAGDPEAS